MDIAITDLNASHNVSMLDAIRSAIQCSNLSKCWPKTTSSRLDVTAVDGLTRKSIEADGAIHIESDDNEKTDINEDDDDEETDAADLPVVEITYKELFRLSTLGGATGR